MMKRKDITALGFMIFALFFGAGNLIFPPSLGAMAGYEFVPAMSGFILTGVGLPFLGLMAIAWADGGISKLVSPLPKKIAFVLTFLLYVAIGPFFGIPRTAVVTYELGISPFMADSTASLFVSSLIFFGLTLYLVMRPGKLLDVIGRFITPLLLIALSILSISSIVNPLSAVSSPQAGYTDATGAFFEGFLQGYLTLDALGALVFGAIILQTIRAKAVTQSKDRLRILLQAGGIAAIALALVYTGLGYLGASSYRAAGSLDGAALLKHFAENTFGMTGIILLGLAILLACLTTSVGLVSAFAEYAATAFPRLSLRTTRITTVALGLIISIAGLETLIAVALPTLLFLYPVVIGLIFLSFLKPWLRGPEAVYRWTLGTISMFSLFGAVDNLGYLPEMFETAFASLPLAKESMAWLLPATIVFGISSGIGHYSEVENEEKRAG
ncbi:branched-chain amino acid transport system II carrier protein [Exiguobacterium flavidum]|uniref:branched-chain amino acid transport system II carrier protein n=1 Tax=Exiguobacterium flavidum TaxID=2184695 RepID=UPI001E4537B0|nr:branched-chain amino acid transport system II carrier protein [Exiguobacterium flavidum]